MHSCVYNKTQLSLSDSKWTGKKLPEEFRECVASRQKMSNERFGVCVRRRRHPCLSPCNCALYLAGEFRPSGFWRAPNEEWSVFLSVGRSVGRIMCLLTRWQSSALLFSHTHLILPLLIVPAGAFPATHTHTHSSLSVVYRNAQSSDPMSPVGRSTRLRSCSRTTTALMHF